MITLNIRDVLIQARRAFDAKALSVQHNPEKSRCFYREPDTGHVCAIGASLDDKTAAHWDAQAPSDIRTLHDRGLFETDDIDALMDLQQLHDHESLSYFERTLKGLEASYGIDQP